MNAFGVALLWCVAQVTLVGLLAAGLYLVVRRIWAAAAVPVVLAGLAAVVVLSLLASSPWPRWVVRSVKPVKTSAGVETAAENTAVNPATVESPGAWAKAERWPNAQDTQDALPSQPSREDTQPAAGRAFWQALLDELSRPEPAARSVQWQWPATAGVFLLVAMVCGLIRLILGVAAVCRERLRSSPVDDPRLRELVDVLCAELGCRRTVEVRQCGDLATPATIGWRRPVLLVPADWTSWTDDECRAVLAHELAHVRGHDCWTLLLGQLGVALHFYHPLVHWLAGRLRLEQELAADAAAASVSGGQRAYLMTIARLALRQQDRRLPWPARTFLPTRTTFLRRIAMLRDSKLNFRRLSPAVRLVVIGAVLLGGALIAGLRGPGWRVEARAEDKTASTASNPTVSLPNYDHIQVDRIDTSFIPKPCKMFLILRPAEVAARPELASWTVLFDRMFREWPKGLRAVDFRQITVVFSEKVAPSGEIRIFQGVKPLDASALWPARADYGPGVQVGGKKMYLGVGDGSDAVLQYDEHTVIWASDDQELRAYMAGKRGILPRWLPKETWNRYRTDHVVWALDMEGLQREVKRVVEEARGDAASATAQTLLRTLTPLWEDSTCLVMGLRAGDAVEVHATATADSEDGAEAIEKTVDAARVLATNYLKQAERAVKEGQMSVQQAGPLPLLTDVFRAMRVERQGTTVVAEGSIDLATVRRMAGAIGVAQRAQRAHSSMNNLKMLGIAMHTYQVAHRRFPPAVLYGPDGKTPYSWRVALLQYLEPEGVALYEQYHFDEPWDSPANRKVLAKMPDMFRSPTEPAGSTNACYFALTGPGTMFDGREGTQIRSVRDGLTGTILLVEAKRDVPWTKPEDIPYAPDKPLPKLGGFFEGIFHVLLADGAVRSFSHDIPAETLRALITRNGREIVKDEATEWLSGRPQPPVGSPPQPNQVWGGSPRPAAVGQ